MKPIEFLGSALDCLKQFPKAAMHNAGLQLNRVQRGLNPFDWKPMNSVGAGVREIRIWDESGTYRVLYIAKLEDAVYVLHCFQKKAQATPKSDIHLAERRYRQLRRKQA